MTTETIQEHTRLIYRTEQRAQVNMVTNIDTTKDHGDKNTHRSNQYKYLIISPRPIFFETSLRTCFTERTLAVGPRCGVSLADVGHI